MANIPINEKKNVNNTKLFSLKSGLKFFVTSNILLVFFIGFFVINSGSKVTIISFTVSAEIFLILLSLIACLQYRRPNKNTKKYDNSGERSKEWIGGFVAFVLLSVLSLIFMGLNIPYPSTLIFCILMTNFMVSLYSIVFHPVALGIYEANVFQEKTTMLDYVFKYIAIYFSGINYYVQMVLLKLPLLLNKLISIVFVLFLLWQAALVIGIFD